MIVIYKHIIDIQDTVVLDVPQYSTILKVARQGDQVCAWVQGNTQRPTTQVTLRIFGTGNPMPEDEGLTFLNTVIMDYYVWHIFLKSML